MASWSLFKTTEDHPRKSSQKFHPRKPSQKAQTLALERQDKWEGQAYQGLGNCYRNIGQNQTAIEYYEKAKQIALKHGDKRIERQAFRGLGNAYLNVGKYQTAIEYFQKAQNIAL